MTFCEECGTKFTAGAKLCFLVEQWQIIVHKTMFLSTQDGGFIAYTRALPELILVVDDQVEEYDDSALQEEVDDIM